MAQVLPWQSSRIPAAGFALTHPVRNAGRTLRLAATGFGRAIRRNSPGDTVSWTCRKSHRGDAGTTGGGIPMQTFVANFVRPSGEQGVLYILAASSAQALVEVVDRVGPLRKANVYPRHRAALLVAPLLVSRPGFQAESRRDDDV
jgi:hypothetical protein